jgi:Protein of unknown function (DUF2971)
VWLSSYYTLNDLREREWGFRIFERGLQKLRAEVGDTFASVVTQMIHTAYSGSVVMISSYSLDPDVLSQWRAYADRGRGFAIGFAPQLMKMPARHLRVLYEEEHQLNEFMSNLRHTYEYEKSIGFKYN